MNPGILFGDHIKTEKIRRRSYEEGGNQASLSMRGSVFLIVLLTAMVFLLGKLFSLQVIQGGHYQTLSDSNRIKTKLIHAPRGIIFDRNGKPLVFNIPGFRSSVKGSSGQGNNITTIHISKEEALKRIAKGDKTVTVDSLREYPYKDMTSHVLGYLGQISEDELHTNAFSNYQTTDWIGKNGIERY